MNSASKVLTQLQADSLVMFTKLHNYHWNVKGLQFYGLHAKTEEFYTYFGTMFDDLAERILQLNGTPLVTVKAMLDLSKIKEDEKTDFKAEYIIENIKKDFEYFLNTFKELHATTDKDAPTQSYADDQVGYFQKELWMLNQLIA